MTSTRLLWLLQAFLILACALWLALSASIERSPWRVLSAQMSALTSESLDAVRALPADALSANAWRPLDQGELSRWRGAYWLRFELELAPLAASELWLVSLSLRGASQLYWDGELLGKNGQPSARSIAELPGRVDVLYPLDRMRAGPGRHEVLVYASSHFAPAMASASADLRVISLAQSRQLGRRWLLVAAACGAIATALMVLSLAFGTAPRVAHWERGRGWLLALGAVGIALPVAEAWRPILGYSYDWHGVRMLAILVLHGLAALLLPSYLAVRFARSPTARGVPRWLVLAWVCLMLLQSVIASYDVRSWTVQLGGVLLALAVLLPRWQAQAESRPLTAMLASMALLSLLFPEDFLDGFYFMALAVLMVYLLLRHADFLQAARGEHARLSAERDRLSAQLLQRAMQPHWLMNTLTSLQELIEQAPEHASQMVDLLAEHFAMLRSHSQCEWVSLADEIKLCRVQLDIAAQVQQRPIAFRVADAQVAQSACIQLPPGILHTLIENSLTHAGFSACAELGFDLLIERNDQRIRLCLRSPLASHRHSMRESDASGTGTRFIVASLDRVFAGRAQFVERAVDQRWQSEIEMPCAY